MRRKFMSLPAAGPLLADVRGNMLIMVASGLIPVTAAIGGGVDISRAYMARARLQQAVDSAALAGRKMMKHDDLPSAEAEAAKFIDFNFPEDSYDTAPIDVRVTSPQTGELCVTASTTLPTSVMKLFGFRSFDLAAESCAVQNSDVNTDIMLVLDVTGSMDDDVGGVKKISALKNAVLELYDTLAPARELMAAQKLRLRIGILPYANTVNVGKLLHAENSSYLETSSHSYYSTSEVRKSGGNWVVGSDPYGPVTVDVSGYVSTGIAASTHSNAYAWKGCIEERQTTNGITASAARDTIPPEALDLIDSEPTGDPATKWRPYLALPTESGNRYGRPPASALSTVKASFGTRGESAAAGVPPSMSKDRYGYSVEASAASGTSSTSVGPNIYCPEQAAPLSELSRTDLEAYLGRLKPAGATLHDIGMAWGIRMISQGPPFPNPEEYNGRPIDRHIIFMTDGLMADSVYSSWGLERRPSDNARADGRVGGSTGSYGDTINARHTARFEMLCEAAKREGITVWTVAFATGSVKSLENCASSSDQSYEVADSDKLKEKFAEIGQNIGALRLSK